MRYLDWDVLLFPSGEGVEGARVPFREFKIQCQGERKNRDPTAESTPLMTTFVPSLQPGTSFQISVHSWSTTAAILPAGQRELWEACVVVDGKVIAVEHFPVDAPWPQIVKTATHEDGQLLEGHQPLRFPPFHDALRNERSWLASDELGRIRVELSAGLWDEESGAYGKMYNIVTFAFQHAPIGMLEAAGIAWPSKEMWHHPLPRQSPLIAPAVHSMPVERAQYHPPYMAHRKMSSVGLHLPMMGAGQPFAGLINPCQNYTDNFDEASRSTSAYSTISASAGPIMPNSFQMPASQQNGAQGNTSRDDQFQFRLPSDQLAQIIRALGPQKQDQQAQQAAQSMPPPPLPGRATHGKEETGYAPIGHYAPLGMQTQRTNLDQHAINAFDRRVASNSNYSDISMHADCNSYPQCITEDPNGCIVHDSTVAPAEVVKGRKEGSSPTKPRDFFSVTLDAPAPCASHKQPPPPPPPITVAPRDMTTHHSPAKEGLTSSSLESSSPADGNGKKRTRSALKALNINDGASPQKADTTNRPVRKASRASVSSSKSGTNDKENVSEQLLVEHPEEALENQEMLEA